MEVGDKQMLRMNKEDELTGELLAEFIEQNEMDNVKRLRMKNQFESKPPILDKASPEDVDEEGKPNNTLVANFARYLVLNFNGYFIGVPTRINHEDEQVNETIVQFWRENDMDDVLDELGKLSSIYGNAYLFLYQDEDAKTRIAYLPPLNVFNIYSDEIKPSTVYGVHYRATEDGYSGDVYSTDEKVAFTLDGDKVSYGESESLYYGRVPLIEFVENEERLSLIDPVEVIINAFNKILSEKSNDIDYFADAYLLIAGVELSEEDQFNFRKKRMINSDTKDLIVKFLEKPNADESQENQLDRLERLIYTLSMVTNTSENQTGMGSTGVASGEALKVKQQPMQNMAISKERKFESGLQTMFKMFFSVITNISPTLKDEYVNIDYTWTRNTPKNVTEEIENAAKAHGILSEKSQLELISTVNNSTEEIERKREEEEPLAEYDFERGE